MKTTHPPPAPPPFSARCGTAILLFAISHFLSGCASAPKALTGDPSTSSIVVVQCKSTWRAVALLGMKESQKILGGTLLNADVNGPKNRTTMVNGQAVNGLIIFSDVSPGVYQLTRVQAYRYFADERSG